MAQAASKNCDICEEKPRREYCLNCEQYFCEKCKTQHLKSKISKDHTFQEGENFKGVSKVMCNDHKHDFSFVCVQCDVPICTLCITESHNGHKLSNIQNTILSLRPKFESDIETKTGKYREFLQELEKGIASLDKETKLAIVAAREDGRIIKNIVDECVTKIIASIEEKGKSEIDKLKSFSTKVRESLDVMTILRNRYESLQEITDNATLLTQLKQLVVESKENKTIALRVDVLSAEYKSRKYSPNDINQLIGILEARPKRVMGSKYVPPSASTRAASPTETSLVQRDERYNPSHRTTRETSSGWDQAN